MEAKFLGCPVYTLLSLQRPGEKQGTVSGSQPGLLGQATGSLTFSSAVGADRTLRRGRLTKWLGICSSLLEARSCILTTLPEITQLEGLTRNACEVIIFVAISVFCSQGEGGQ